RRERERPELLGDLVERRPRLSIADVALALEREDLLRTPLGDVPQVGCGFYCSPAAAVSATGAGEDIARVTLSRRVASHVERGLEAQAAADLAIEEFGELTGSSAGVIVVDSSGSFGSAYSSRAMQTARASDASA
ncbi:isoaspartyl peptidase/L-asparaginase, partial [Natrarchaeobius oligotrophus]